MDHDLRKLHEETFNAFKKVYIKKRNSNVQAEFNEIWRLEVKSKNKSEKLVTAQKLLDKYKTKSVVTKSQNLLHFVSVLNSVKFSKLKKKVLNN